MDARPDEPVTSLGCNIHLEITETDDRSEAVATLMTSRGTFEGRGVARRHPDDPQVPMIGEELAIGRALDMLSEQLMGEAASAIRRHESDPVRLFS